MQRWLLLCLAACLWATGSRASYIPGDPRNPPCPCDQSYAPICTKDGRWFASKCQAQCAGAEPAFPCDSDQPQDECEAVCREKAEAEGGGGGDDDDPGDTGCACIDLFAPVCGGDGQVYGNGCQAMNCGRGVDVRWRCACLDFDACAQRCADLAVWQPPQCKPEPEPPQCACQTLVAETPVCAMSGVVYPGECQMNCKQQQLEVRCDELEDPEDCPLECRRRVAERNNPCAACGAADAGTGPACGTSGRLYINACLAECDPNKPDALSFACADRGLEEEECREACQAEAAPPDPCARCALLKMPSRPACGVNGALHDTPCYLNCNQDAHRFFCDEKNLGPEKCAATCQELAANGNTDPCEACSQTDEAPTQVCGVSGIIHPSICYMQCKGDTFQFECGDREHEACMADCREAAGGVDRCRVCSMMMLPAHPVCGASGVVHPDFCQLWCNDDTQNFVCGERRPAECAARCKADANQDCTCGDEAGSEAVCTLGGEVAPSACEAGCRDKQVLFSCGQLGPRECADKCAQPPPWRCAEACPPEDVPICSLGGRLFKGFCQLECFGAAPNPAVACSANEDCAQLCLDNSVPDPVVDPPVDPPECICDDSLVPVCAADRKVWSNPCVAQCARVKPLWKCDELSEAQCAVECAPKEPPEEEEDSCDACPRSYLPHCGKDGAVYPNLCLLKCARVELLFPCADGEDCADACQQSAAVCGCDLLSAVAEVCGYSGAVYQHPCFARCAGDRIRLKCAAGADCAADCQQAAAEDDTDVPTDDSAGEGGSGGGTVDGGPTPTVRPVVRPVVTPSNSPGGTIKRGTAVACAAKCSAAEKKKAPLCAADGRILNSACDLKCTKPAAKLLWACGTKKNCKDDCRAAADKAACAKKCKAGGKKVCGVDGKVYANDECRKCSSKAGKRVDCAANEYCPRTCKAAVDKAACDAECKKPAAKGVMLCGKDGKAYPTAACLKCRKAAKHRSCRKGENCAKACKAEAAKAACDAACKKAGTKVCGKDGKVYANPACLKCCKASKRRNCRKGEMCPAKCKAEAVAAKAAAIKKKPKRL